jgi:hypothetical protein
VSSEFKGERVGDNKLKFSERIFMFWRARDHKLSIIAVGLSTGKRAGRIPAEETSLTSSDNFRVLSLSKEEHCLTTPLPRVTESFSEVVPRLSPCSAEHSGILEPPSTSEET